MAHVFLNDPLMPSTQRKIVVAHSPDTDDAFMFYGLATGKVHSPLVKFEHQLSDIQSLNIAAHEGRYEMTAISYHTYPYVADRYILTASGSSVGDGYGPIIVSKRLIVAGDLKGKTIAVPGKLTTAYLTLRLFQPDFEPKVIAFDKVLDEVMAGKVDAGLVIHEGQLNYHQSGLHRIVDLGAWWKEQHGLPLPLGANAVLRSLPAEVQRECRDRLRDSIEYALEHREEALLYALRFARDLDQSTAEKFVGMYVNHHTIDMAPEVMESAKKLLEMGYAAGLISHRVDLDYV